MIEIITAQFDDLPAILALQKLCYHENAVRYNNFSIRPLIQTQHEIEHEFEKSVFLKAMDQTTIIGSVRAHAKFSTCHIGRLFVHPDFQNQGIAKQLLLEIEKYFPLVDRYELFTGYKDDKNIDLYHKVGYITSKVGQREDGMIFIFLVKMRQINY